MKNVTNQPTRSYHCFISTSTNELQLKRISADPYHSNFQFGETKTRISLNDNIPGQHYACMYDNNWHIAIANDRSFEYQDVHFKFLRKSILNKFSCPSRSVVCWIPITDMICKIESSKSQENTTRNYEITQGELNKITNVFVNFYE